MLNHYAPGIIIAIDVPFVSDDETVDVNFRRLLKSFPPPTAAQLPPSEETIATTTTASAQVASTVMLPTFKKKSHYDNIIEKLEMKYRGQLTSPSKRSDDGLGLESGLKTKNKLRKTEKDKIEKQKTSRTSTLDQYDYDDPFIDDEELLDEVEAAMVKKRLKTKHFDGFFVSTGNLEVVEKKETESPQTQAVFSSLPAVVTKSKDVLSPLSSIGIAKKSDTLPASSLLPPSCAIVPVAAVAGVENISADTVNSKSKIRAKSSSQPRSILTKKGGNIIVQACRSFKRTAKNSGDGKGKGKVSKRAAAVIVAKCLSRLARQDIDDSPVQKAKTSAPASPVL